MKTAVPATGTDSAGFKRASNLRRLFAPRSIAVVGATERPNAPSRRLLETLLKLGFKGRMAPVHPSHASVLGLDCFRSLSDIPGDIDAAAFCVEERILPDVVGEAARKGVKAGVIFGSVHDQGIRTTVFNLAREHGISLCGPNCMGVFNPANGSSLYLQTIADASRLAGNVALVTQSGSVAVGMLGDCRRFGFSHIVSSGDEAVTTIDEYVEYLIDDPDTRVIALFIESVRNVAGFTAALDRAARVRKPVVVLKIGRSTQARAAVVGHTGGIAGDGRVFSALMARHNGIEVSSLEEMTEVIACFQAPRRPAGPRVGIVTASGGQVEMILDEADGALFELPPLSEAQKTQASSVIGPVLGPGNPLDAWGTGDYTRSLAHGLDVIAGHPDIDMVVLVSDTNDGQAMSPTRYTDILHEASLRSPKPFYFMNTRSNLMRMELVDKFRGTGVGMLTGLRQGLGALGRMGQWAQRGTPGAIVTRDAPAATEALARALNVPRSTINEVEAKVILRALGLSAVEDHIVATATQAVEAAASIGYPVVLKVASDEIPHRSEHGLVALGLADAGQLAAAFADHDARIARLGVLSSMIKRVVQPMAPKGVEVIVGVGTDPELGPYVAFGAGGVLVELIGGAVVRALPLREGEAAAMVRSAGVTRLLDGCRGRPACDIGALVNLIESVAAFAFAHRDKIREIDINPVFVGAAGKGCAIADALIVPE